MMMVVRLHRLLLLLMMMMMMMLMLMLMETVTVVSSFTTTITTTVATIPTRITSFQHPTQRIFPTTTTTSRTIPIVTRNIPLKQQQQLQQQQLTVLHAITSSSSSSSSMKKDANVIIETTEPVIRRTIIPILNFHNISTKSIDYIDRLDDAIMGGISTSTVRQYYSSNNNNNNDTISTNTTNNNNYAIWSGICRTDGGGFCGFRTNPFLQPIRIVELMNIDNNTMNSDSGGLYIKCRFVSDNEPQRRIWKLSTRTKPDRGELLYQAPFVIQSSSSSNSSTDSDLLYNTNNNNDDNIPFQTIYVPFDSFRLVRGPSIVPNGTPLNISNGIYQLGITMSQFLFVYDTINPSSSSTTTTSSNNTRIEKTMSNFRDGYFELHIAEMGVYYNTTTTTTGTTTSDIRNIESSSDVTTTTTTKAVVEPAVVQLNALTKEEMKQKRSIVLKGLFLISKLFFSEQSQRRKSTLRILQKKYNMSRLQAIYWGYQRRLAFGTTTSSNVSITKRIQRYISSIIQTLSIVFIDTIRSILPLFLKVTLLYPIRFVQFIMKRIKK